MILSIALALLLSEHADANEVQECISKCTTLIKAQDKLIVDLDQIRTLQGTLIKDQNNKINRLEEEAARWYRNPVIIFFTGLSVGVMINQYSHK